MNILDFLITIFFVCTITSGLTYSLILLLSLANKNTTNNDKYSFTTLFIIIFVTLILNKFIICLFKPNQIFLICIFVVIISYSLKKLYKLKMYKCILISIICTSFPFITSVLISLILLNFNLNLTNLLDKPIAANIFYTGITLLETAILLIINICNKSFTKVGKIKFLGPQLFIIFICLFPNMLFMKVTNFNYS